jgi:hypothetical protein
MVFSPADIATTFPDPMIPEKFSVEIFETETISSFNFICLGKGDAWPIIPSLFGRALSLLSLHLLCRRVSSHSTAAIKPNAFFLLII